MMRIRFITFAVLCSVVVAASDKETVSKEPELSKYVKPNIGDLAHLAEPFDAETDFEARWVKSEARKDGVDENISKYDGKWAIEEPAENPLVGDLGLTLKSEAKHAAVAAALPSKFRFEGNPLFLQYEVRFQKALECGGAYIKLLADTPKLSLERFGDKTEYTIMFGPDKCGHDGKIHFILQHENPSNGKMEEKHAKAPSGEFAHVFTDKKTHLFTLIVRPGNTFDILVDKVIVNTGSLLTDMDPPINPSKEIDDPNDKKPEDWDEREKIPDPSATKPLDWDEDAPRKIPDPSSKKPADWNEDEPDHIPDPNAVRPKDWDNEEDGDWEAPLVPNPKCKEVGCGEWKAALVDNPNYKGKWTPPLIANPSYKGIWKAKKIINPNYFEDSNPFGSLKPIAAVGFELWSMQSDVTFDNIILASDQSIIDQWTSQTWDLKHALEAKSDPSAVSGIMSSIFNATEERPWLWALYALAVLLPFVLIYVFCFRSKKDRAAERKKTDEPVPDDMENEEPLASGEDAETQSAGDSVGRGVDADSDSEAEEPSKAVEGSDEELGVKDTPECETKTSDDGAECVTSPGVAEVEAAPMAAIDEQVPLSTPADEAEIDSLADKSQSKSSASNTADSPTSSPRNPSQKRKPRKDT